jgi:branched-chain amino acid transport system substrate-binding protein
MKTTLTWRCAALIACAALGVATPALAQDKTAKIGVLNDMSSLYADIGGPNSVAAIKMAVEDSGLPAKGWKIDVLSGDHQNKPDVGVNIARQWIDNEKVDVIADTPNSGVALAVNNVVKEKNAVLLNSGAATADLTGKACTPNTISFTYDTYMLANGTGKALTKAGGDTWFFLTSDYAFGHALERDTAAVVTANGGKVLGGVKHPLNTSDFSSFLLQAQSSKAKIIGLANAGLDTTNSIKQAAEFGIVSGGQKLAGLLLTLSEVHGLGLQAAQGLVLTEGFYWDQNDKTREFSGRFIKRTGRMPSMIHAGTYSATLQYLKAVKAAGTKDSDAVAKKLKELPVDDMFAQGGKVLENGRMVHDLYLFEVKKPSESKKPWDYYKQIAIVPGDKAFPAAKDSGCPLTK